MKVNDRSRPIKQRTEELLIRYPDFDAGFQKAKMFVLGHQGLSTPGYFQLVGGSRVGKTRLLKTLKSELIELPEWETASPPSKDQGPNNKPKIVLSRAEAGEKTKSLVQRVIYNLQEEVGEGSLSAGVTTKIRNLPFSALTNLLRERFQFYNVKGLMLDELHNLLDSSGRNATSQTVATFKQFLDDIGVPVIVAGTEASYNLTEPNSEIHGRRHGIHELAGLGADYKTRIGSMKLALKYLAPRLQEIDLSVFRQASVLEAVERVVENRFGLFVAVVANAAHMSTRFDNVVTRNIVELALDNHRDSHDRRARTQSMLAA